MIEYTIYTYLDRGVAWMFGLPGNEFLAFGLGLAGLALAATVIGELCMAGAYFFNARHFATLRRDMVRNNNLSIRALGAGDKASYKACNALANEAFGKNFFAYIALFAASVWPAFFALGWLDFRFGQVDFVLPLAGSVGPAFFFVPVYIAVRVIFNRAKPLLPLFKGIKTRIAANEAGEKMISFMDLLVDEEKAGGGKETGGAVG